MEDDSILALMRELDDHAKNPPGNDIALASFYQALKEMFVAKKPMVKLIGRVRKNRPNITNKHLINLLFRAYQYLKFEMKDLSYRHFNQSNQWHDELSLVLSDKRSRIIYENILVKKSTTTTIYQRYIGPYVAILQKFGNSPITIADFGCGGNYGLRGIELKEPFKPIQDMTPGNLVSSLLTKEINFIRGLAIDKENPDGKRTRKWRMACSFYPVELDNLEEISLFEERIKKSSKVRFLGANLLLMTKIPSKKFDAVILSMILYELSGDEQIILLEKVKEFLKPGGIIIVQDFAEKDKKNKQLLNYNISWFGSEFGFRTFIICESSNWTFWEILKWNNGRCNMVRPGKDFNKLFSAYKSKAPKPAFAHSTS